jgi:hypothetical protein
MLAEDVIDRLKERVTLLENRVEGAAHMAALVAQNQLPQVTPAANVISSGLQGSAFEVSTGLYRQYFDETITVYLTFRNLPGKGARAIDLYLPVRQAVIEAICGWAPTGPDGEEPVGVFRLTAARTENMQTGTLLYRIDFAIGDQLRIET